MGEKKSISFDQLLLSKKIVDSMFTIIFANGDFMHVNDEYSDYLISAIEKEAPCIFFDKWDLTEFVNLEKQNIICGRTKNCLESLYLFMPNKLAYPHLCEKYNILPKEINTIVIVIDRYEIDKKNLKFILGIEYFDELTFFEIIKEYQKFTPMIKNIFIEIYGISCPRCKNATNMDFTIFPNVHFAKCAKCRFVLK